MINISRSFRKYVSLLGQSLCVQINTVLCTIWEKSLLIFVLSFGPIFHSISLIENWNLIWCLHSHKIKAFIKKKNCTHNIHKMRVFFKEELLEKDKNELDEYSMTAHSLKITLIFLNIYSINYKTLTQVELIFQ